MNNISIYEFKQAILNFITNSDILDEVKRLVLKEILEEQSQITLNRLKKEIEERDSAEQEEKQDE